MSYVISEDSQLVSDFRRELVRHFIETMEPNKSDTPRQDVFISTVTEQFNDMYVELYAVNELGQDYFHICTLGLYKDTLLLYVRPTFEAVCMAVCEQMLANGTPVCVCKNARELIDVVSETDMTPMLKMIGGAL